MGIAHETKPMLFLNKCYCTFGIFLTQEHLVEWKDGQMIGQGGAGICQNNSVPLPSTPVIILEYLPLL